MQPEYSEGFLKQNLLNCRFNRHCEGGCGMHKGDIQVVRVIDPKGIPHDWGFYTYCQAAMEEDQSRGMNVILESQPDFLLNI